MVSNFKATVNMRILTSKEWENLGIPFRDALSVTFEGRTYAKGPSFAKASMNLVKKAVDEYTATGIACILTEQFSIITVWKENSNSGSQPMTEETEVLPIPKKEEVEEQQLELTDVSLSLPLEADLLDLSEEEVQVLRYRGVELKKSSSKAQKTTREELNEEPSSKPKRTYRGVSY